MCGNINCKRNKIWDPMWLLYVAVFPALGATAHCSPFSHGVFRVVKTQSATRKKMLRLNSVSALHLAVHLVPYL